MHGLLLLQLQIPMLQEQKKFPLPAMEPTRPTHKGGVTVLRQLEAARVFVPPCLLSEFASQYSDPFLCAGNRKTGNSAGPSGLAAPETEMVAPLHVEVPNLAPKLEPDME